MEEEGFTFSKKFLGKDKKIKSNLINAAATKKWSSRNANLNQKFLDTQQGFLEFEDGENKMRVRQKDIIESAPQQNILNVRHFKIRNMI